MIYITLLFDFNRSDYQAYLRLIKSIGIDFIKFHSYQQKIDEKVRMQPRISKEVHRLARSKAAMEDVTLEYVVERLLRLWVSGKVKIVNGEKK